MLRAAILMAFVGLALGQPTKTKCDGKAECLANLANLTLADAKKDLEAICEMGAQCISEGVDACDDEATMECAFGKTEVKWCAIQHDVYQQLFRRKFQERLSEEDMAKLMDEVTKCTTEANDDSQEQLTALLCQQKVMKCVKKIKIDPAKMKPKAAAAPEEPTRTFLSAKVPEEAIEAKLGGCDVAETKAKCLAGAANLTDITAQMEWEDVCGNVESCAGEVSECTEKAIAECAMGKTEVILCAIARNLYKQSIQKGVELGLYSKEGVEKLTKQVDDCWYDVNMRHISPPATALVCQQEMADCYNKTIKLDASMLATAAPAAALKRAPSSPTYETTAALPFYTTGEPESTGQSYRKKRAPSFPSTAATSFYQTTTNEASDVTAVPPATTTTTGETTTKPIGFGKRAAVDFILWKRAPSSVGPEEATTAPYDYSTQQPGYSTTSFYRKKRAPSPPTTAFPAATDGGYSTTSYYRKKRAASFATTANFDEPTTAPAGYSTTTPPLLMLLMKRAPSSPATPAAEAGCSELEFTETFCAGDIDSMKFTNAQKQTYKGFCANLPGCTNSSGPGCGKKASKCAAAKVDVPDCEFVLDGSEEMYQIFVEQIKKLPKYEERLAKLTAAFATCRAELSGQGPQTALTCQTKWAECMIENGVL